MLPSFVITLLLSITVRGIGAATSDLGIDSVDGALQLFNKSVVESNRVQNEAACTFLKKHFSGALRSSLIAHLEPFALLSLTSKNWITEEIEVFNAVQAWAITHGNNSDLERRILVQALQNVFLVAMSVEQLESIVLPSKLFPDEEIIEALTIKAWNLDDEKYLRFPNQLASNDVVTESLGAKIIKGKCHDQGQKLLSSNKSAAIDHFCFHDFSNPRDSIIVRLGAGFTIDTIALRVFDFDFRRYSLIVDVSADATQWNEVGRMEHVRGQIHLKFKKQSVKFIRIRGTNRFPSGAQTLVVSEIRAFLSRPRKVEILAGSSLKSSIEKNEP